jgi:hypothetical protein
MSRIRSIKPEFWTSEQVMECSLNARLMFIGTWNFADDSGRLPYSPKSIKAQIFPSDEISLDTIRGMVNELSTNGLLMIYSVEEKEYLQITGWQHQRIDKPQKPKYPAPFQDDSTNAPRTLPPDTIGEDKKGKEKKEDLCPVAKATRTAVTYSEDFETNFWKPFPRTAIMSKKEAWREWMKLEPDQRSAACRAIPEYDAHLKKNPTLHAVHACRFLSQNRAEGILEIAAEKPKFDVRAHIA